MASVDREKLLNGTGIFAVISAFKLRPEWEKLRASAGKAAEEVKDLLAQAADRLAVEMYVTRGLKASSDYFLRVHAYDLADAQFFFSRYRKTTSLGLFSDVTETLVGLTKERRYITAEKTPALDKELVSQPYQGDNPRFAIVIPIRKTADWWNMPEEQRREEIALHTQRSMPYLSKVKRKLYYSTGLDDIDFITYFETDDLKAFHELAISLASINENRFHSRYGNPLLLGSIHGMTEAIELLSVQE